MLDSFLLMDPVTPGFSPSPPVCEGVNFGVVDILAVRVEKPRVVVGMLKRRVKVRRDMAVNVVGGMGFNALFWLASDYSGGSLFMSEFVVADW